MESEEEFHLLYTCGLCENVMTNEELNSHSCLDGYPNVYVDKNNTVYPMLDNGEYISKSVVSGEEVPVLKNIGRRKAKSTENPSQAPKKPRMLLTDEEVEELIGEVHKREPLWNYTSNYKSRKAENVEMLWNDVANADGIKGKLNGKEAKAKFKSLKDTFRKIIQAEMQPSGSARRNSSRQWKFYNLMGFTRDHLLNDGTESNINNDEENIPENMNPPFMDSDTMLPGETPESLEKAPKKRRKDSEESSIAGALMRIADNFEKDEIVIPPPPPTSKQDDVDGMLILVGSYLRQMPPVARRKVSIEIINLAYSRLQEHGG